MNKEIEEKKLKVLSDMLKAFQPITAIVYEASRSFPGAAVVDFSDIAQSMTGIQCLLQAEINLQTKKLSVYEV